MFRPKQSKLSYFLLVLKAYVFGIPYGPYRLRPLAYQIVAKLSDNLSASQSNYDFVLSKHKDACETIQAQQIQLTETYRDLQALSKALVEISNHPHILTAETQSILDGYKLADNATVN